MVAAAPSPKPNRHAPEKRSEAPQTSAKIAGLRYVCESDLNITRHRTGRGFTYRTATNRLLRDRAALARIKALVIPPAWTEVRICRRANGHLQAVGRDARGRKQYRYHDDWRRVRNETKYDRLGAFAAKLPKIRRVVNRDLRRKALDRRKVLATIVKLLDETHLRIGNQEYARGNGSYGLTTLRDKHADIRGDSVRFEFVGKSGKLHRVDVEDRRIAKIVKKCQDLPGQTLFQFLDEQGVRQAITSTDVNDYLREIAAADFTAKDFRTWAGTVLAAQAIARCKPATSARMATREIADVVKQVAAELGNTPAVCRKCYIHPAVFGKYAAKFPDVNGVPALITSNSKKHRKKKRRSTNRRTASKANGRFAVPGLQKVERATLKLLASATTR
jgi:DNA topoisomerase-1